MVTNNVKHSAAATDSQMPSKSSTNGNSSIAANWNSRVLTKEMTAEIRPLFRAVNIELPKMLKPHSRKDTE